MRESVQTRRNAIEGMWKWFLRTQFPLESRTSALESIDEETFEYFLKCIYPMAPSLNEIAILIGTSKSTVSRRFRSLEKKGAVFHHGDGKGRRFFLTPKVIESLDPGGKRVRDMLGKDLGSQDPDLDDLLFVPDVAGRRDFKRYLARHNHFKGLLEERDRQVARQEEKNRFEYTGLERILEKLPTLEKGGEKLWLPLLQRQIDLIG